jgi:hypothetical protein
MMATPHILAGAAVAKVARRPWLAWPAAFGSHFLLDYVPHIDSHTVYGMPGEEPNTTEAAIAIVDFVIGAALVTWLVWRRPERRLVLVGGLCGILIDLIEVSPGLGPWFKHGAGTEWLSTWHHAIQIRLEPAYWPVGIATQVVVIGAALKVIGWRRGGNRQYRPSAKATTTGQREE